MFFSNWEVLLVDDEPDVLSVSTLAMREFEVYGLPLTIHTAESKADAIELLRARPRRFGIDVAIIDVVMESDLAGLELCQFVRDELGDSLMQLFIRTGQPGVAAERDVIEQYDINGYYTKAEATEDKLYSMVKSGIRQYLWSTMSLATMTLLGNCIAVGDSRDKIAEEFGRTLGLFTAATVIPSFARVDDTVLAEVGWGDESPSQIIQTMEQSPGIPLSPNGDMVFMDPAGLFHHKLVSQPNRAQLDTLVRTTMTPSEEISGMTYSIFNGIAYLWHRAT